MCWSRVEEELKHVCQFVFDTIGIGVGEKTYHDAVFAELSLRKHLFECSHRKCIILSETVAPISLNSRSVPVGFMRSDIVMEWKPVDKKRKVIDAPTVHKCVLELKSTNASINSGAVMQILCYMRAYGAQFGIVCNFLQRCDVVQTEMTKNHNQITFFTKNNTVFIKSGQDTLQFIPKIETFTVQHESS